MHKEKQGILEDLVVVTVIITIRAILLLRVAITKE
jgi:hypothetical protein